MKVLVTGGAGFVGSHLVDHLVTEGHAVQVIDLLHPAAHDREPDYRNPCATYHWADLCDLEATTAVVAEVDAVSHQAAMVGLGTDFDDVTAYTTHNSMATATLLQALHRTGFSGRLVLASSMVVYGEGRYRCPTHGDVRATPRRSVDLDAGRWEPRCPSCGSDLEPLPVTEDAPLDPRSVYAATKLHQEHLCTAFGAAHPAVAVGILRYHNIYGPRMPRDTPYAGVASIFRSAVERAEPPRVYEDGGQLRDFIHVDDVAHANLLALTGPTPFGGVCNVATGAPRTVLDLATQLVDAAGPEAPRPRVVGGGRAGDVRHVFASPERARRDLGFVASTSFDAGMRAFATAPLR
jgi:dTDP-L-rhamnose 4-epimerase